LKQSEEAAKEELADIFSFVFFPAQNHCLDIKGIVLGKIKANGEKYLIDKSTGI